MKKIVLFYGFLFIFLIPILGQTGNVGIGTATPDGTSKLDVSATDKGMLIPRVALTAANAATPITKADGSAASTGDLASPLLVYNTATAGSGADKVTPGFYYWNGSRWIKLISNLSSDPAWMTTGNSGTTSTSYFDNGPQTNAFVGTTDNQPVEIYTNASSNSSKTDVKLYTATSTGAAVTAPSDIFHIRRNGTSGVNYPQSASFALGKYGTSISAESDLGIRLGNGNIYAPDVTVMTLRGNGNTGIGTTAPLSRLHLMHTSSSDGLLLQNNTGGAGSATNINFATYADIVSGTSRPGAQIKATDGGSYSAYLSFSTKTPGADANALVERMRIDPSVVGILSSNPVEYGFNVSGKEANAGKIGYQTFTTGALDIVGAGTTSGARIVKIWDDAVVQQNVITGKSIATGKLQIVQGPGTGSDNTWHTVELSSGYGAIGMSAYCTGSYLDGDIKVQGVDISNLLSGTSGWYSSNGNSWGSNATSLNASSGASCDNCTHQVYCPDNYIATGWQVYANSQLDYYLKLKCTQVASGYSTVETGQGVESILNFPNANADNFTHTGACPTGTFVKGLSIYAGTYLDTNFRVWCSGIKKN
ncbi:MAG: hypothetical protein U0T77_04940 [Chitinophagales bacterium]